MRFWAAKGMFIYTSPRDLFRENGLSEFDLI